MSLSHAGRRWGLALAGLLLVALAFYLAGCRPWDRRPTPDSNQTPGATQTASSTVPVVHSPVEVVIQPEAGSASAGAGHRRRGEEPSHEGLSRHRGHGGGCLEARRAARRGHARDDRAKPGRRRRHQPRRRRGAGRGRGAGAGHPERLPSQPREKPGRRRSCGVYHDPQPDPFVVRQEPGIRGHQRRQGGSRRGGQGLRRRLGASRARSEPSAVGVESDQQPVAHHRADRWRRPRPSISTRPRCWTTS